MRDLIDRHAAIDTEGLDEQIRCEMCRNPMHTDRGCDGNCKYDEKLYERIMQILGERIKPLPLAQPERPSEIQDILDYLDTTLHPIISPDSWNVYSELHDMVSKLPSAEPEHKWIPVSERLPEYNDAVLTWDGHAFCIEKRIPYIRDDDGEPIEGDWWVGDEYDEYVSECYPNLRDGAAIAWMPLPEPYKEESNG